MKSVQINTTCGIGSTGKICVGISNALSENGIDNIVFYAQGMSNHSVSAKFSCEKYKKFQALKSRIFGNLGFNSRFATRRLLKQIKAVQPDIVHIHNIHGHDCNLKLLFRYFKKNKTKLVWTFHDCWAFTAYCPYFDAVECDKWKNGCNKCPYYKKVSWFFDRSKSIYDQKKKLFEDLDLTIVTPSNWLADLVKQSFLKKYNVCVINNGIDLSVFRPTESDFKEKYGINAKYIVLGVAFDWDERKGLDVFVRLAERLDKDYQIVLVGTNDNIDRILPNNIISIHRTQNQNELAEIYSAADVFVNPTREENFPTVNMESLACGTPVLTFATGGSPEIADETCGSVVPKNDEDALLEKVIFVCEKTPYSKESCVSRAKKFDMAARFFEYAELYKKLFRMKNNETRYFDNGP